MPNFEPRYNRQLCLFSTLPRLTDKGNATKHLNFNLIPTSLRRLYVQQIAKLTSYDS